MVGRRKKKGSRRKRAHRSSSKKRGGSMLKRVGRTLKRLAVKGGTAALPYLKEAGKAGLMAAMA